MLGEAPGIDLGCLPARILGGFWMILCIALVVCGLLFLFQFRPKFGPITDQLLFYRLCLTPVALPSSCRGGGLAQRVKFAVPRRGAGVVLKPFVSLRSRKVYPSLPSRRPSADRRTLPRKTGNRPFFDFFRFFSRRKKRRKKRS